MNSARLHTDGERHNGDTTRVHRIPPLSVDQLVGEPMTADDLAASIYAIQNLGRPADECDTLPEGITAEDVERAMIRHRKEANRRAIEKHNEALSTPLPKRPHTPADQRIDRSEEYTGRVPFWFGIIIIIAALVMGWGMFDLSMRLRAVLGGAPW